MKKILVKLLIRFSLKLHNLSYRVTGRFSSQLEPDGIHPKHRLMKYHDWFTQKIQNDWDVLDIGCGNGALANAVASVSKSVTAIDIEEKNINKAEQMFGSSGVDFICADATRYEFKSRFHAIILSNVLEHIEHRVDFLKKLYQNQDQDNPPVLLLRVPMITRDWISMYKKEQGVEWRLDRTHFTEYTLEQVFDEMEQADLQVQNYDIQFGEFYGVVVKRGIS